MQGVERGKAVSKTIKDIAQLAGVSYGTVSRVLNKQTGVNSKTKERVQKVIDEVGYRPNAIARSLVKKQSNTIALMVPDISHPFFGSMALAVDKEAYKRGFNTILCNTDYNLEIERKKMNFLLEKRVDGIIIKPALESSCQFSNFNIPTVLISHSHEGETSYIDIENIAGGKIAGDHLIDCGYKKIAFIGGYEDAASTQLRLKGLRKAMEDRNISFDDDLIRLGAYSIQSGYTGMADILAKGNIPDSVFCANDLIALGVLQKADECGLKVPEQLGVVGFDDILIASLPQIRLTTIRQPIDRMGVLATEMLIKTIHDGTDSYVQKITLRPELKIRATTAPKKSD